MTLLLLPFKISLSVLVCDSLVFVWYPDDGRFHLMAAEAVMMELGARLCFDWLVYVVGLASQLQRLCGVTCGDVKQLESGDVSVDRICSH